MKKGFTLVELLAVIVILAIIAIITIPMISNVIEKSKLGAMEDSAYGLIDAANYYYAEHMNEMSSNKIFVIENGVQTSEEKLNYKGKIEGNAKVLLASNGKVALCLTSGKSYAKKEITDSKVVMNIVSSDTTCEINGLESDSDITIDISGSNSSYYNKNEIDDKLNDIRTELSDLSSIVSNNTTAIDNLKNSLVTEFHTNTEIVIGTLDGKKLYKKIINYIGTIAADAPGTVIDPTITCDNSNIISFTTAAICPDAVRFIFDAAGYGPHCTIDKDGVSVQARKQPINGVYVVVIYTKK